MRDRFYRGLLTIAALVTLLGSAGQILSQTAIAQTPGASPEASPIAALSQHGIRIEDMDLTVDPGADFYQFANGGWLHRTEIPANAARFGNFAVLEETVNAQLNAAIAGLDENPTTDTGKVKTVYNQALDIESRNAAGITPISPILDRIAAITSVDDVLIYQMQTSKDGISGLFDITAGPALDDATLNIAWLGGPSLSLPAQSYYLDDSPEAQVIRDGWVEVTAQLLVVAGYDEASANVAAEGVLAFETAIAKAMTPEAQQNDPNSYNNPRTIAELKGLLPAFDWDGWLAANGVTVDTVTVTDIDYLTALSGLLSENAPATLRDYFAVQLMWDSSPYLTTEIDALAFSFNGPILQGVDTQRPDDERALDLVQNLFPDALGQAYVAEAFSPEAKASIEHLVATLIAVFRQRIADATWMSDVTKQKAIEKLELMTVKVGYPDTWETYEKMTVGTSLFESIMNADELNTRENLDLIGKPVDRTKWGTPAFQVNAFYSPQSNEITFPAAILQAPFFDPEADAASNYGAIGWVIGHEITHGFDRSGSQFDGYGNLSSWWTDEDRAAFEALNEQVAAQYSQVEILPGLYVNGELTVTENVADLGGMQTAYNALLLDIGATDEDKRQPWFLTQQQRFFIAAASVWRQKETVEFTRMLVSTDTHAPASVRGVLPASNMDAFFDIFDIQPGDPMYKAPEDRLTIW